MASVSNLNAIVDVLNAQVKESATRDLARWQQGRLMVVSRTTGAIFQCSITLMNGINPVGGCAQISSTNLLS